MPSSSLAPLDAAALPAPPQRQYASRERIFWVFQVLFWLGIGLVVLDRTGRRPGAPRLWMPEERIARSMALPQALPDC